MNPRFHRFFIILIFALLVFPISSQGIKIVTRNILNFPGSTGEGRIEYFIKIIDELDPDILVVQDMLSFEGVNLFLNEVMNHSSKLYKKGRFFDGPDSHNNRVQIFSAGGQFLEKWSVEKPSGIAIDKNNNVYIPDVENNFVQKLKSDGTLIKKWGETGAAGGQFDEPIGIAVDENGNIYITEMGNDRVHKFVANGNFVTMFGGEGTKDGRFKDPMGIVVDAMGNIYVADTGNNRIQKFGLK